MNAVSAPATNVRRLAGASVGIPPRHLDFQIPEAPRYFLADNATATTFIAVLSAFFPPGERFFMESVRHFRKDITDPVLKAEVAGFMGQEAIHGREHERLNDLLMEQGINTKVPETAVKMALKVLEQFSPSQQLACTTFMEHFTALVGEQLLTDKRFQESSHGEMLQLWLWHAMEELEHKAVAYDVYETIGNSRAERILAFPLVAIVMLPAVFGSWGYLLAKEGKLFDRKDLRKGLDLILGGKRGLISRILPKMGLFARKDYHPNKKDTKALEAEWREKLFGENGTLRDQVSNLQSLMH
ncbi:MAG: metal-dependent hydrolase [Alcanivoracaceae bacterium]